MAAITGANTYIAIKAGTTYATANAVGAGSKIEVESLSQSDNAEELTAAPIGGGVVMTDESQKGATSPSVSIEKIANYDDAGNLAIATFFGSEYTRTHGSTSYAHSIIQNSTIVPSSWLTLAFQTTSAGVMEFPSAAVTKLQISVDNVPNYLRTSIELLANTRLTSGTSNSWATVGSTTMSDTTRVVAKDTDTFQINAQAGAALSTETVNITSFDLTLEKPLDFIPEIKGAAGNGVPVSTGSPPLSGTLVVTFKELADLTWMAAYEAGTEYKACFDVTGNLIGGSSYQRFRIFLPRLKIVQDPDFGLQNAGINPLTVTFKCLAASSAPTGMLDVYPHLVIHNTKATSYIA